MPVRVKQRALKDEYGRNRAKEWDALRRNITGMLLAWENPVTINIKGLDKSQAIRIRSPAKHVQNIIGLEEPTRPKSFNVDLIRSTLLQGADIEPSSWETWVKTSARTPFLTIRAVISLEPAPSKDVQFLCLGVQHLRNDYDSNLFYDEINRIFASSSFGTQEDHNELGSNARSKDRRFKQDGFTNRQLRGSGKGIDRWPMFFIRIDLNGSTSLTLREGQVVTEKQQETTSILTVLEAMITGFLTEHHFRPRKRLPRKRKTTSTSSSSSKSEDRPTALRSRVSGNHGKPSSIDSSKAAKNSQASAICPLEAQPNAEDDRRAPLAAGDLTGNVIVPKFARSDTLGLRDDFSSWSRIKSGSRKNLLDLSDKTTVFKESVGSNTETTPPHPESSKRNDYRTDQAVSTPKHDDVDSLTTLQEASGHDIAGFNIQPERVLCEPATDHDPASGDERDSVVEWTNPSSKVKLKINARTGLVVDDNLTFQSHSRGNEDVQRPQSACLTSLRAVSSRLSRSNSAPSLKPDPGSWADALLASWENPIFQRTEESIPQVSLEIPGVGASGSAGGQGHRCVHQDFDKAFKAASLSFAAKLSRKYLQAAEIIAQVDQKFILVKMTQSSANELAQTVSNEDDEVLVLIDQHAADERIRIESLLTDLCKSPSSKVRNFQSSLGLSSAIDTISLAKPLSLKIPSRERDLFITHAPHFAHWGILFEISKLDTSTTASHKPHDACTITILTLPPGIAERCRIDPKQLTELMRAEVWKLASAGTRISSHSHTLARSPSTGSQATVLGATVPQESSWLKQIGDCPQGILDMLNSRSCRSAIMFNDELTLVECEVLVRKLAECAFPFQCAHGRPSMVPLVSLGSSEELIGSTWSGLGNLGRGKRKGNKGLNVEREENSFLDAWQKWEQRTRQ